MKVKDIVGYLREKNKLSLRNVRTGREIWHVFVSRVNLLLALLAFLLVVFVAVLTAVAYTPLLNLVPGYEGGQSRDALLERIVKLDSLSAEMEKWEAYQDNFARILDGQLPLLSVDTLTRQSLRAGVVAPSGMDSVLRSEMTDPDSPYRLSDDDNRRRVETSFEMLAPLKGIIARSFTPTSGSYGVEITPTPGQSVLAVLDGTVILNTWTPQYGNTLMLQHGGNMISVYKQVGSMLRTEGEHIKAGEAVGMTSADDEGRVSNLIFELWYNGTPVDPENYITF